MKRNHPLRNLIRTNQQDLKRLCSEFSGRVDELHLSYFSTMNDRMLLRNLALTLNEQVSFMIKMALRESVEITIRDILEHTNLTLQNQLELEVKIEKQLSRTFKGKTLNQRINYANRVITSLLLQEYNLVLSGVRDENAIKDVFDSTGTLNSALGWNKRLLDTEILRAYHYAMLEFARETNASAISFKFDKRQLERRKEYLELADGGPYTVDNLPDYPRPNASYLLELSY